jgi:hypothetical protein
VAVVLTLVQTKQVRINIHMYINETIQKQSTNNTKHSKYKYTYYQNTQTIVKTPPHTLSHILQNKLNNHSTRNTPNEIVTIQSSTLSIRSP